MLKVYWKILPLVIFILCLVASCHNGSGKGESKISFSFAVVADPRAGENSFENALREIRDMNVNPDQKFTPADFLIIAGDMDPILSRYRDYTEIFSESSQMKGFLPVKGNHDDYNQIIIDFILPEQPPITLRDSEYVNYYMDWENSRFIMVDAYSDLGADGCVNTQGKDWVEQVIESSPASIEHIFISFHEPAFPRHRHLGNSFDQCPDDRNAFWNMLISHKNKVRAVFVGHTHLYYRMRVLDPSGECPNDFNCFPDEEDGIYQIDAGAAGNGDRNTMVQVQIYGKSVYFRAIDAANGIDEAFSLIDSWEIN